MSAPKDTVVYNGISYNISGAIYKCPVNLNKIDDCEQITVDFDSKKSDESRPVQAKINFFFKKFLKPSLYI